LAVAGARKPDTRATIPTRKPSVIHEPAARVNVRPAAAAVTLVSGLEVGAVAYTRRRMFSKNS